MPRFRKTVEVHETTVKKVAQNAVASYPTKKRAPRTKPGFTPVQVRIWSDGVNEMIVDWVHRNNIDWRLIEIVSENEIIIRNNNEEY